MNAAQVLTSIASAIAAEVEGLGGVVEPAGTPADAQAMLATGPARWRLILLVASGAQVWRHLGSKINLVAIIQTAVPPTAKKGVDVFATRGAGKLSVLELENAVINLMRRIQFQTEDGDSYPKLESTMPHVAYESADWLISAEEEILLPTRERRIIFSLAYGFDTLNVPGQDELIPCPLP